MSLMRPLSSMRNEMDRLFSEMERDLMMPLRGSRSQDFLESMASTWAPAVNVSESENEVTVTASVPGIEPKDIEVSVEGNHLSISGENKKERENTGKNYHRREIVEGRFQRMIQLPAEVDSEKADARFENGMLHVSIPKAPGTKRRRIEIHQ